MRTLIIFLLASFCIFIASAKDDGFSFDYPDSLKKNADVIFLFHNTTYTRTSKANLKEQVHFAVTILSDRGDDYADFILGYDKFSTIGTIECTIYNLTGKKVRQIKNSEIRDYSAFDGFSLFSDNRIKRFTALNPTYPYTIELKYEISNNGFLAISSWYPLENYRVGVKETTLTIKYPADLPINYKEKNIGNIERKAYNEDRLQSVSWKAEGLKPIEYEQYSPVFNDQVASVSLSPREFVIDNSEGMNSDWKSYGEWRYSLLDPNFKFTELTKKQLLELKTKYTDKIELTKQVYKFMQSRTRYVGIQFGIGGVRPFSPQIVDEVGYGDCKALSYYTKSLLDFVGIPSFFTIIGVNEQKIEFDDFPSKNQTNHVILCVPFEADTVWLECTSQTAPFNHLFDGTTGRKALLVTAEGGKIVHTPKANENRQINKAEVSMNSTGEIICTIETSNSGSFYDDNFDMLQLSDKELRERLLKESPVSDIILQNAKVTQQEEVPEVIVKKTFTTRNIVSKAGNRIFIELSPFMNVSRMVAQKSERRSPLCLDDPSVYEDEITLQIPAGYTLEFCPEGKSISSDFGVYQSKIESNNDKIIFRRTLKLNEVTYPKERYSEFIKFINNAADADKCKVILKI